MAAVAVEGASRLGEDSMAEEAGDVQPAEAEEGRGSDEDGELSLVFGTIREEEEEEETEVPVAAWV